MRYPQCFRLYELASILQASLGSLSILDMLSILQPQKLTLPHINKAASQQWGWLTSIWLPHNNEDASHQCGCLKKMWLSHNNEAASHQCGCLKKCGCLTTMRLPHINVTASHQCGCLKIIWLPHNNEAASQSLLKTTRSQYPCDWIDFAASKTNAVKIY